jgi:uncharacterized membrane protein
MDGVMRDAEKLGVRNWRIEARDRCLEAFSWVGKDSTWVVAPVSEVKCMSISLVDIRTCSVCISCIYSIYTFLYNIFITSNATRM